MPTFFLVLVYIFWYTTIPSRTPSTPCSPVHPHPPIGGSHKCPQMVEEGATTCLTEALTKVLGLTPVASQCSTQRAANEKVKSIVTEGLKKIESRPIQGEMKMWIHCDYLIPSTRFHLTANQTLASTISALEGAITKYIKKWLKLSRNATQAIIHHPSVVKTPSLASVKVRAKLSLLASLSRFADPTVMEMKNVFNDSAILWRNDVNQEIQDLFREADQGWPAKSLQKTIRKLTLDKKKEKCNEKLPRVQVQSKFVNIGARDYILVQDHEWPTKRTAPIPSQSWIQHPTHTNELALMAPEGVTFLPTVQPKNVHNNILSGCPLPSKMAATHGGMTQCFSA